MIDESLTLVLPAHNEAENLRAVIENAVAVLPRFFRSYDILIVNDGSQDETGQIAEELSSEFDHVGVVHHFVNRGYGAALRTGFATSTGDWVMVMDSDRQFDIGDLVYMAPFIGEYDLVAGYRTRRRDPAHRRLFGKTFRLSMRTLFGVQLYDIDCAFKVMRGDILRSLNLESDGALISTELMARWARAGGTWTQVGINHYPRLAGEQSGGSLKVVTRAMRDVPALWYRLNRESPVERADKAANRQSTGLNFSEAIMAAGILLVVILSLVVGLSRRR